MTNISKKLAFLTLLFFISIKILAFDNNQDMIGATQPSIVSINSSIKGTILIPNITFDYENNTIATNTKSFSTTTISNSKQGTGFIISSDGIIATHSNVIIGDLNSVYRSESKKYLKDIKIENKKYNEIYEKIFNYLKENSIQNIEQDIKIIKPKNSYQAKIFYTNSTFKNEDFVGLLKIEADNLPSIPLSDIDVVLGQNVYSLSYSLLENLISEPIFNQGVVNTINNKQYTTNISSLEISKGSPVLNKDGKVVGITSSLGFVIPSSSINEVLATTSIGIKPGLYIEHYKSGLILLKNNRCKSSLIEFDKAKKTNPNFLIAEYIQSKIDECNTILTSGNSRDDLWSEIVYFYKNNKFDSYTGLSLLVLFLLLMIFYKYFKNRFKKDEKKIQIILNENDIDEKDIEEMEISIEEKRLKLEENKKTKTKTKNTVDRKHMEIEPFEKPFEFNPSDQSIANVIVIPPEKVEITLRPQPTQTLVTPPNAIQSENLVVINSFKTLNKPIKSLSSDSTEMSKHIKTDLPTNKDKNKLEI